MKEYTFSNSNSEWDLKNFRLIIEAENEQDAWIKIRKWIEFAPKGGEGINLILIDNDI